MQYLGLLENIRIRRAGFAFRAPFFRFLDRYKKLNPLTWSKAGEWKGHATLSFIFLQSRDPKEGCRVILASTPLDSSQWQLGATKVFLRHPESLFFLEENLERVDYDAAMIIQKSYRKLVARKQAIHRSIEISNLIKGKKDRRSASKERKFEGMLEFK